MLALVNTAVWLERDGWP